MIPDFPMPINITRPLVDKILSTASSNDLPSELLTRVSASISTSNVFFASS